MKFMRLGASVLTLVRTMPFGTGVRGVLYLGEGVSVHTLEDDPVEPGVYLLSPDDTGDFRHWVLESSPGSRLAGARANVEVHEGNTLTDTAGCILPGQFTAPTGVSRSGAALDQMRIALQRDMTHPPTWVLIIKGIT